MSKETAFLGEDTVLGKYWTKRRHFDYLINKKNFRLTFGKSFQQVVYLDPAIANGPEKNRRDIEDDTRAVNFLIRHLGDIKAEQLIFITTCDMLPIDGNEQSPIIEHSDDPYVQNRINLYESINLQFGRVLNVHIPTIARPDLDFSPLLHACVNPPKGKAKLPFAPLEFHQFYFPERILGDVEKCVPLGISSIIPAMPPLTTMDIIEALAPQLDSRLRDVKTSDAKGSDRKSIHSLQWLDPMDGYLVSKEDQIALLKFYYAPDSVL